MNRDADALANVSGGDEGWRAEIATRSWHDDAVDAGAHRARAGNASGHAETHGGPCARAGNASGHAGAHGAPCAHAVSLSGRFGAHGPPCARADGASGHDLMTGCGGGKDLAH